MSRDDMSTSLIHFTKGTTAEDYEGAFFHLLSIVNEGTLRGGNGSGFIKGGYICVCFTEAPLASIRQGFVNSSNFSRYSPFGVMFGKTWVYAQKGRPVIYESEEEFGLLPESHRWRHVSYEPTAGRPIDFTWEREWRILCSGLEFGQNEAVIIVPSHDWADRLVREHQDVLVRQYSTIMDEYAAEYYGLSAFPWRVEVLNE